MKSNVNQSIPLYRDVSAFRIVTRAHFTWVWEDDITVIQRFAVLHFLLLFLLTITPIWIPALRSTQLLQPRLGVVSIRWAASSLGRQPEPQHALLWKSMCVLVVHDIHHRAFTRHLKFLLSFQHSWLIYLSPAVWPVQTPEHSVKLYCSSSPHPPKHSRSPPELLRCLATCYTPDAHKYK